MPSRPTTRQQYLSKDTKFLPRVPSFGPPSPPALLPPPCPPLVTSPGSSVAQARRPTRKTLACNVMSCRQAVCIEESNDRAQRSTERCSAHQQRRWCSAAQRSRNGSFAAAPPPVSAIPPMRSRNARQQKMGENARKEGRQPLT